MAQKLGVADRCHFLGFRSDVKELYLASDVFLFASKREGLPRSTMEAMLAGLPCIVSNIRGNVDLIDDNKGGILVKPKDYASFEKAINKLMGDKKLREQFGRYNQQRIQDFNIEIVKKQMLNIFKECFEKYKKNIL